VHPTLLPEGNVIANVNGVFNAISVTGDVVGTTLYIGRGRGPGRHRERGHQRHRGRRLAAALRPGAH
jgi:hypothetical protein